MSKRAAHDPNTHPKDPEPKIKGLPFYSQTRKQDMMLVTEGEWEGWLVFKHPDGQWVSLRRSTEADWDELAAAVSKAHHAPV